MKRSFLLFTALFTFLLTVDCAKTIHYSPIDKYKAFEEKQSTSLKSLSTADSSLIANAFVPDSVSAKTSNSSTAGEKNDSLKTTE
jgi:hypothetical protein